MKLSRTKLIFFVILFVVLSCIFCKSRNSSLKKEWMDYIVEPNIVNSYFDKVVCICLPERKPHMIETFSQWGLKRVEFFDAYRKQDYTHKFFIDNNFLATNYSNYLNVGRVCCHYSATTVYRNFLNSSDNNILIFEDDMKKETYKSKKDFNLAIGPLIKNIPEDWDYLNFSKCYDFCKKNKEIDNPYWSIPVRPLCRTAIALNKKAAKIILSETIPMTNEPGDRMIGYLVKNKKFKAYATKDITFFQHREKFGSNLNNKSKTNPPKCA